MKYPAKTSQMNAYLPGRFIFGLILLLSVAIWSSGCEKGDIYLNPEYKLHGLNFSPFKDGQDPNDQVEIEESQLRERMEIISPLTDWVRTYGVTLGLEKSGAIAHELGLKAAIGAWLGRNDIANEREIQNLIHLANNGKVDIAIVGSEVLFREDMPEEKLIGYLQRVRDSIPAFIPVTTAEPCRILLDHPALFEVVDIVFVNHYPFWEGVSIDCAIAALHECHNEVVEQAMGKQVVVSESGWPSDGITVGNAMPNIETSSTYFMNFVSWAKANEVPYFYFSAFDEKWKAIHGPEAEGHFGLWDHMGELKPDMDLIFRGKTMEDNWSADNVPGGPGEPKIQFTFVPKRGRFENLKGRVLHVNPVSYKVAIYINVQNRWWTKPFFNRPLTVIGCDGNWSNDITTGGMDQEARKIIAFLVPNGFFPPIAGGVGTLPQELYDNALDYIEVDR